MALRLSPDELVARIRAQLAGMTAGPVVIRPSGAGLTLYGLPVKVEGVGVVGQYLGHSVFTVSGPDGAPEEMWEIVYGVTELFAKVEVDGAVALVPIAVNGVLTPDGVRLLDSGAVQQLFEHKRVLGTLIVPRKALINLEDAMSGRDLVLRVDPYGVEVPGDVRRRIAELGRQLEHVRRAYSALIAEYEREKSRREIAESQLNEVLVVMESLKGRLAAVQSTVAAAESSLLDMWSRMRALTSRAATERQLREQLTALLDDISSSVEAARQALQGVRSIISEALELHKGAKPPKEGAVEGGERGAEEVAEKGEEGGGGEGGER